MAKLWMCERLLTLIRVGEAAGDCKEWAGEGWTGAGAVEATGRVFVKAPEAGAEPEGVGCCECGRKHGLGGVGAGCCVAAVPVPSWELLCCDRWPGVELDCGAPVSAMGTSAGGATARGALAADEGEGRTGV